MDNRAPKSDSFDASSTIQDHEEDEWGYGPDSAEDSWDDAAETISNPSNLTSWKTDGRADQHLQSGPASQGSRPFSSE